MSIEDAFKRFIAQECVVYTLSPGGGVASVIECVAEEIGDGWVRISQDEGNNESIVNIDNIIRIREYPRNKNGKKKIIFD